MFDHTMAKEYHEILRKEWWDVSRLSDLELLRVNQIKELAFESVKSQVENTLKRDGETLTYTCLQDFSGNLTGVGKGGRFESAGFVFYPRKFTKKKLKMAEVTVNKALFTKYLERQIDKAIPDWRSEFYKFDRRVNIWMLDKICEVKPGLLDDLTSPMEALAEKLCCPAEAVINQATDLFDKYQSARKNLTEVLSAEINKVLPDTKDFLLITHNDIQTVICFETQRVLSLKLLTYLESKLGANYITIQPSHVVKEGQINITVSWVR